MSTKEIYDETQRLKNENRLLEERERNERLKREAQATELLANLAAFMRGDTGILVTPLTHGSYRIVMEKTP